MKAGGKHETLAGLAVNGYAIVGTDHFPPFVRARMGRLRAMTAESGLRRRANGCFRPKADVGFANIRSSFLLGDDAVNFVGQLVVDLD